MFNEEQRDHMRYLATIQAGQRCWSGWCELGDDGWKYCSAPRPCPIDATLAERIRQTCECCGSYPDEHTGRMVHRRGCTREARLEHYQAFDLGGEAG